MRCYLCAQMIVIIIARIIIIIINIRIRFTVHIALLCYTDDAKIVFAFILMPTNYNLRMVQCS